MDYAYLCKNLGHCMGLPVRIYEKEQLIHSYSYVEFAPDPVQLVWERIRQSPHTVEGFDEHLLFFGAIKLIKKQITLVIGPAFSIRPNKEQSRALLHALNVQFSRVGEFSVYLENTPTYPIENFFQILCLLNYYFNKEKLTISELLARSATQKAITSPKEAEAYNETESIHNTYIMEKEMLSYITAGRPDALKTMFSGPPTGRQGQIAHDELRQKKNMLVCAATLASRAAIQGGLSQEIAFSMSDTYIQKGELLSDYNALTYLSMSMLLDFASRVEELNQGAHGSKHITAAVRYINQHLNEKFGLSELSSALGISRAHLCALFRDELNTTVNDFVTARKIEEAKRLLSITNRPISGIAEALSFSSQSYFQNVFKKNTGKTPQEYRAINMSFF